VVIEDVPPGLHQVLLRKDGCIRQGGPVWVEAGRVAVFHAETFRAMPSAVRGAARAEPADGSHGPEPRRGADPDVTPPQSVVEPVVASEPPKPPAVEPPSVKTPAASEAVPSVPVGPPAVEREPDMVDYVAGEGDTLASIAKRFGTTVEQVRLGSRRTGELIRPGDRLKVLREMPRITVHKRSFRLRLHVADGVVREYPVCVGRGDLTPAGEYRIVDKVKRPDWWHDGKRYRFGDPRNVLGTRWMTLIRDGRPREGYGIHGTTMPETVPGDGSSGCVRMLNRDVEELFAWAPRGTRVVIEDD
jgi:lipoprotein-anchoring transpeptidase ErfK/SrfK